MKKLSFIAIVLIASSCSKKSDPTPAVVTSSTFMVTFTQSGDITYFQKNMTLTTGFLFTGTTDAVPSLLDLQNTSYSFTSKDKMKEFDLNFVYGWLPTTKAGSVSFSISIYRDGKLIDTQAYTLTSAQVSITKSLNYKAG